MKYLSKAPIFCTPPNDDYERSWERVFGKGFKLMAGIPIRELKVEDLKELHDTDN